MFRRVGPKQEARAGGMQNGGREDTEGVQAVAMRLSSGDEWTMHMEFQDCIEELYVLAHSL